MADYLAENQCPKCGKKLNTGFKCEVCDTMADKEERIYICSKEKACQICKDNCAEFDGIVPCGNCGYEDFPSMTPQEAIKRLAIGWCSANEDCNYCDDGEKGSEDCLNYLIVKGKLKNAEAALNALLEGVKK